MPQSARHASTVLLADDEVEFLEVIGRLLDQDTRLSVVGAATTGAEAVDLAARISPDVVLIDLFMADTTGLVTARRLQRASPSVAVLLVSADDPAPYQKAAHALGLPPILSKRDLSGDSVIEGLRSVLAGDG